MSNWLKRLSIVALLGFPLAVFGTRIGLIHWGSGLKLVAATLVLSAVVLLVSLLVMVRKRNTDTAGFSAARTAVVLSLLPVLGIGSQIFLGRSVPSIHNITTDVSDPPGFIKVKQLRVESDNPLEYDAATLADLQRAAYPQVKTLISELSPDQAYARALAVAHESGWDIVNADQSAGIIEATETTGLWAFKDDVVIRIRPNDGGSLVDLRSVSRVGKSDLGANAKRIKQFLAAF